MIEAVCLACRETFTPSGLTYAELEHFEREGDWIPCGGLGIPVSAIVARYLELAAGNGALAAVAFDDHNEVRGELVDTALEVLDGISAEVGAVARASELLFEVLAPYAERLKLELRARFVRQRVVVELPVIVDLEPLRNGAQPSPTSDLVAAVKAVVETSPVLLVDDERLPRPGSLDEMLLVNMKESRR